MQILAVDLGTDLAPALALGAAAEPGVMDRPPRRLSEHVITRAPLVRAHARLGHPGAHRHGCVFSYQYWQNGHVANGWICPPRLIGQLATAMTRPR
ncbi:MAG: cation transporting ATPase C-terminal domain-containing protein [Caldilineaceae bacterium]